MKGVSVRAFNKSDMTVLAGSNTAEPRKRKDPRPPSLPPPTNKDPKKQSQNQQTMAPTTAFSGRALLLLGLISATLGGTADHRYKSGEHVELWVNKVRSSAKAHPVVVQSGTDSTVIFGHRFNLGTQRYQR